MVCAGFTNQAQTETETHPKAEILSNYAFLADFSSPSAGTLLKHRSSHIKQGRNGILSSPFNLSQIGGFEGNCEALTVIPLHKFSQIVLASGSLFGYFAYEMNTATIPYLNNMPRLASVTAMVELSTLLQEEGQELQCYKPRKARGIYFLVKGGRVVYIGQAVDVFSRVQSHVGRKDFDDVYFFETTKPLDVVERSLIRRFRPKFNKRII